MDTQKIIDEIRSNSKIELVKDETTFTADELLNNLWATLSHNSDGTMRALDNNDYRLLGIMASQICTKKFYERQFELNLSALRMQDND